MTIHTKWMQVLRQEAAPEAFGSTLPHAVEGSFIDGQIKLMKADAIQTWSQFLFAQLPSKKMRQTPGAAGVEELR